MLIVHVLELDPPPIGGGIGVEAIAQGMIETATPRRLLFARSEYSLSLLRQHPARVLPHQRLDKLDREPETGDPRELEHGTDLGKSSAPRFSQLIP
jgi:hypothetical protein